LRMGVTWEEPGDPPGQRRRAPADWGVPLKTENGRVADGNIEFMGIAHPMKGLEIELAEPERDRLADARDAVTRL